MLKIRYVLLLLFASTIMANTNIITKNGLQYFSDVVIVKFKLDNPGLTKVNDIKAINSRLRSFGVVDVEKNFVGKLAGNDKSLSRIYKLKLSSPYDPLYISGKISKLENIEWAEPLYLRKIVDTPNDPNFSKQYGLKNVQAEAAWDISKGDSNIIVAIVDSGVDWAHEDLNDNIWQNDDPINGIDDDNNGYIDDIRGWDFGGTDGSGDNDPKEDSPTHGTHVAGIAAAVTNNSIGVAGLAYNCTIMPVKTSRHDWGDNIIAYGYEGIVYAADNGADVINCSWGGFGYSNAEQEVIDYAVKKGAVVVCAAGNDGVDEVIFPAAYNGALSVGNTSSSDALNYSSNYGIDLDVCAPGTGIYSTWQDSNEKYIYLTGTSMASPLVAGLAGLTWQVFPDYTPLQIIEQIRVNSDNIDAQNSGKENLLGSGRVNAFKTLNNKNSISVRLTSLEYTEINDDDGVFASGDKVKIKLGFMNYLSPIPGLTVNLTTLSNDVTITKNSLTVGAKATLEEFDNINNEFEFTVNQNSANDVKVIFKISYSNGSYSDFEMISVLVNPTFRIQSGNNISTTITSKGTLAFNDYPNNTQGSGFTFMKGDNLLYEAGLMYGVSQTELINSVRSNTADYQDKDFNPLSFVRIENPGVLADQEGFSTFNDDKASAEKLGIETDLHTYTFSGAEDENYIIMKYLFTNKSGKDYSNFYAGIFYDWDIDESSYEKNVVRFDSENNFGYVYCTDENKPMIAMALLSKGSAGFYGITNDGSDRDFGIYNGFTDESKWKSLSSGITKTKVGPADISTVISAGPYEFENSSTLEIGFVIAAGLDSSSLAGSIANARDMYTTLVTDISDEESKLPEHYLLSQNYPNPFNPSTVVRFQLPEMSNVKLEIFNMLGERVELLTNGNKATGRYEVKWNAQNLSSGIYLIKLSAQGIVSNKEYSQIKKALLLK